MSLLLALASIAIAGKMVEEVAKDVTKVPARQKIQEDSKNGNFDVVTNFEEILYVCEVKRKKHDSSVAVLPYTGYRKCLQYIQNHHLTTEADEQRFIEHYNKVLNEELAKRQLEYDKRYYTIESKVKSLMNITEFEIVRFEHLNVFVSEEDVQVRVKEISENTFFGDFLVGEIKIKRSTSAFKEIWGLRVPVSMKYSLDEYYKICAQKCGYIK